MLYLFNKTNKDMTTIIENTNFKIQFNGLANYFVIDNHGTCWKRFNTERKALNYFKKLY